MTNNGIGSPKMEQHVETSFLSGVDWPRVAGAYRRQRHSAEMFFVCGGGMPILRIKKRDNPFVMIDKRPINDERLSWKAKGLLVYLLSKPDDWMVWVNDLVKRAKDGERAVRSGIKELIDLGYVQRTQTRDEKGRIQSWEYFVREIPLCSFPHVDNQDVENGTHTKNDLTNSERQQDSEPDGSVTPPTPTLFTVLAEVCKIDIDKNMITSKQRGQLNSESKRLKNAGIDCAGVRAFGKWWYAHHWRGQKQQPPDPSQIRSTWKQFKSWKPRWNGALPRGRPTREARDPEVYISGEYSESIQR